MKKVEPKKELTLADFDLYEKLNSGMSQTFTLYPDEPLISMVNNGVGFGRAAIDFLKIDKTSRVVMLKKAEIMYISVLPFYSKLNGYNLSEAGKNNIHCSFRAKNRGFVMGYYKLLKPIFVGDMDLFELELFDKLTIEKV